MVLLCDSWQSYVFPQLGYVSAKLLVDWNFSNCHARKKTESTETPKHTHTPFCVLFVANMHNNLLIPPNKCINISYSLYDNKRKKRLHTEPMESKKGLKLIFVFKKEALIQ